MPLTGAHTTFHYVVQAQGHLTSSSCNGIGESALKRAYLLLFKGDRSPTASSFLLSLVFSVRLHSASVSLRKAPFVEAYHTY
jgi:hypothetical protein